MSTENKEKIVLIGGGDFAKKVFYLLKSQNQYDVVGYTDVEDKGQLLSVPYLGKDTDFWMKQKDLPAENVVLCIAGNIKLLPIKEKIIKNYKSLGVKFPKIISDNCFVHESVKLEEGVIIFDQVYVDFDTLIGKFSVLNLKCTIGHDAKIGSNTLISPHVFIGGGADIGDNSFVGSNGTVNPYLKICDNTVIGSSSVATKDIDKSGIYIGVPAKFYK